MQLGPMPNEEMWNEWKQHDCTKRLLYWSQKEREEKKEMWADGLFSAAFDMEMAVKNAGATGACSVHKQLLELDYDEIVIGASDEEKKQVGPDSAGVSSSGGAV